MPVAKTKEAPQGLTVEDLHDALQEHITSTKSREKAHTEAMDSLAAEQQRLTAAQTKLSKDGSVVRKQIGRLVTKQKKTDEALQSIKETQELIVGAFRLRPEAGKKNPKPVALMTQGEAAFKGLLTVAGSMTAVVGAVGLAVKVWPILSDFLVSLVRTLWG